MHALTVIIFGRLLVFRILGLLGIVALVIAACSTGNDMASTVQTTKPVNLASPDLAAGGLQADNLVLKLKSGDVKIQLLPKLAPKHVARVQKLADEGFYNGLTFHRVIPKFMAQTGDPTATGAGGSTYPDLKAEFSGYVYKRGTVGAARTSNPNSANSQFFICFNNSGCRGLTNQYTVWGQVVSGMEHVDKINPGEPPVNPDRILKAHIERANKS